MGVVAAIIPTTNPTSTVMYKILISVKAGNGIAVAPHPRAAKCTYEAAEILRKSAEAAGAPKGLIGCIQTPSIAGTQALMQCAEVAVILATGGHGIVHEAYSSGKPAYGVGSGNAPAFIEKTANVKKAVADIVAGKCFDYGLLCSSENSMIVDISLKEQALAELKNNRAHVCSDEEKARLEKLMFGAGNSIPRSSACRPLLSQNEPAFRFRQTQRYWLPIAKKWASRNLCPLKNFHRFYHCFMWTVGKQDVTLPLRSLISAV